jgi:hypothetical protein
MGLMMASYYFTSHPMLDEVWWVPYAPPNFTQPEVSKQKKSLELLKTVARFF